MQYPGKAALLWSRLCIDSLCIQRLSQCSERSLYDSTSWVSALCLFAWGSSVCCFCSHGNMTLIWTSWANVKVCNVIKLKRSVSTTDNGWSYLFARWSGRALLVNVDCFQRLIGVKCWCTFPQCFISIWCMFGWISRLQSKWFQPGTHFSKFNLTSH